MKSNQRHKKVLFLCTHNSSRSQMAEAFLRELFGHKFEVYSAGTQPAPINSLAVAVMSELNFDISEYRSKGLTDITKTLN